MGIEDLANLFIDELVQFLGNARQEVKQFYNSVKKNPLRFLIILIVSIVGLFALTVLPLWQVSKYNITDQKALADTENSFRTTLAQIIGGAAIGIGLYYTWQRNNIAQEGQITERFTRAVDQLGNRKIEIRLGGIYALERIANESRKDYWPIMEILTAYVRKNSGGDKTVSLDSQTIITVIGRCKYSFGSREINCLNLQRTNLQHAILSDANFPRADFFQVDLSGANLTRANLLDGNLSDANLTRANLLGANFYRANLSGSNLSEANLSWANLTRANLSGSNLSDANLTRANLLGANFYRANLTRANLFGANFYRVFFAEANLVEAIISTYKDMSLKVDLSFVDLSGANLSRTNLCKVNLQGAKLLRANLSEANLSGANLQGGGVTLKKEHEKITFRTDLSGANLSKANLSESNLSGADLSGANLQGANLSAYIDGSYSTSLREANLSEANLSESNLSRADLSGAKNLTIDQLSKVKTLYKAELDEELLIPLKEKYPNLFEETK